MPRAKSRAPSQDQGAPSQDQGYLPVPYATGPAYGYTIEPAYNRPYAADPVFGYLPPCFTPW
jgi:hypothetical protein